MIIICTGSIGRFPIGGHAWANLQYLCALRALGHDVYYLEECGEESWVYNWETEELTTELEYPTNYIRSCLEPFEFGKRWIYRAGDQYVGMNLTDFLEICAQADLLIIRGAPIALWRKEYELPRRRVFIDVDPGFTQIKFVNGDNEIVNTIMRCDHLFTISQRIGEPDCLIPTGDRHWVKTVSPVFLPLWQYVEDETAAHFSTILQWRSYKEVVHNGITYGNKDKEFHKFIELPRYTTQPLRLALTGALPEKFTEHGWNVVPGWIVSRTPMCYQEFIYGSRGEFGVAKQGYIAMSSGWFSDRSACYLASGRPALLQDTGLRDWLPVGEGVLTFRDTAEALAGIEIINSNYEHHRTAARQIAEQYFSAEKILNSFLDIATN